MGASLQVNDKFRVGAQGISRVFGAYDNYDLRLDWGFADYRFNSYFGVRVGKVKYPLGLYNESRDVDAGRTSILLSQSIYPESVRSFVTGATGGSLYGHLESDRWGGLDYQLTLGQSDIPDDFQSNELLSTGLINSGTAKMDGDFLGGVHLLYTAPWGSRLDGLTVGFTHSEFRGSARINDPLGGSDFNYDLDLSNTFLSLEYQTFDWTFGCEFVHQQMHSEIPDSTRATYNAVPGFGSTILSFWDNVVFNALSRDLRSYNAFADYQVTDKYSVRVMWARTDPKQAVTSRDRYTLSQRYDLTENIIGKLEYSQVYDSAGKWGGFLARIGYSF